MNEETYMRIFLKVIGIIGIIIFFTALPVLFWVCVRDAGILMYYFLQSDDYTVSQKIIFETVGCVAMFGALIAYTGLSAQIIFHANDNGVDTDDFAGCSGCLFFVLIIVAIIGFSIDRPLSTVLLGLSINNTAIFILGLISYAICGAIDKRHEEIYDYKYLRYSKCENTIDAFAVIVPGNAAKKLKRRFNSNRMKVRVKKAIKNHYKKDTTDKIYKLFVKRIIILIVILALCMATLFVFGSNPGWFVEIPVYVEEPEEPVAKEEETSVRFGKNSYYMFG